MSTLTVPNFKTNKEGQQITLTESQRKSVLNEYVHFHGSNFKFFWGLWKKNLNISASARWILTKRPDLERLLNSTNYEIT